MRRPSGYALFFRAGSANNARNVNTDGTLNRNNAYNGNNGLRPRFDGSPDLLTARDGRRTLCPIIQGRHIPPAAAAV